MADPDKQKDEPVEEMVETPPNVETAAKNPTPAEKPRGPDQAAQAAKEAAAEAELKAKDTATATAVRDELKPAENENKDPDPKITPEELYEKVIAKDMDKMIEALSLQATVEALKGKPEKEAVKTLLEKFSKIPFRKWAFFPAAIIAEKSLNCSGAAMVFGAIMNKKLGIKTQLANPVGHAANVVTFSDGTTQYVDPRNNEIHPISLDEKIDERDGYKIYKIKVKGLEYTLMPVANHEHGDTLAMAENINSMEEDQDKDPQARETGEKYKTPVSASFAAKYIEGRFIKMRDTEAEWQAEAKRKSRRRTMLSLPILEKAGLGKHPGVHRPTLLTRHPPRLPKPSPRTSFRIFPKHTLTCANFIIS